MAEKTEHTPDIVNRLRGIYRIPITDGLGAVGAGDEPDNPEEFVRRFPTVPIQERAADLIVDLLESLKLFRSAVNQMHAAMNDGVNVHGAFASMVAAEDMANAAIEKAEGRS